MYFNIGKVITENQEKYGWGKSNVEKLFADLNNISDGKEGYSPLGSIVNKMWKKLVLRL